jgi:3,4-dihydroxy 2-butanone 4-phosphate synthase/GTP cyclohydrolase II
MPHRQHLASIEEVIEEARNGRMFILVDDEDRENEGDLVIPAQMATPEAINFMATHGRGLICLAMNRPRVESLKLPLMSRHNGTRHQTAFTVSIEAREGVTTGISAPDRARTIAVAIDPEKGPDDIVTPGHIFPLVAKDGGVLVRAGHTEAAVDISRLAGLNPSGVICEIMKEDGTMARLPDLIPFAQKHGLKIATIADLISYRRRSEKLVQKVAETTLHSEFGGEFRLMVYGSTLEPVEHLVLMKGEPDVSRPVYVRMHALDVRNDVLGDTGIATGQNPSARRTPPQDAMRQLAAHGSGVLVLLNNPHQRLQDTLLKQENGSQAPATHLRDYGIGAQILLDLGIREMILLSNSQRPVVGLEGYGLKICGYEAINA